MPAGYRVEYGGQFESQRSATDRLTVLFIATALFSGFAFGLLVGTGAGGPGRFLNGVTGAVGPLDAFNVIAKALVPAMLAGVICCTEGLSVGNAITEIPQAVTRAVQRSVVALFFVSLVISLLTYL